jgi:hypothetical protein
MYSDDNQALRSASEHPAPSVSSERDATSPIDLTALSQSVIQYPLVIGSSSWVYQPPPVPVPSERERRRFVESTPVSRTKDREMSMSVHVGNPDNKGKKIINCNAYLDETLRDLREKAIRKMGQDPEDYAYALELKNKDLDTPLKRFKTITFFILLHKSHECFRPEPSKESLNTSYTPIRESSYTTPVYDLYHGGRLQSPPVIVGVTEPFRTPYLNAVDEIESSLNIPKGVIRDISTFSVDVPPGSHIDPLAPVTVSAIRDTDWVRVRGNPGWRMAEVSLVNFQFEVLYNPSSPKRYVLFDGVPVHFPLPMYTLIELTPEVEKIIRKKEKIPYGRAGIGGGMGQRGR